MARTQKLKVYRTPIGFHDAYVAAPSQKAALEAWGSDANLFARGDAELVEDPELTREPLEKPGTIIRRLRGTAAEQLAALPADQPKRSKKETTDADADAPGKARASTSAKPAPKPKPIPRPDRSALDEAREALEEAETRHRREREELARREAELTRERRATERAQATEIEKIRDRLDRAEAAYERAMEKWRG